MAKLAAEITLRGMLLGAVITAVFMAANLYIGLKTGMTFSSSIPAAVISMALLRVAGNTNILENNIVQTQASAAGTLCNVVLVLPGLVIVGYWHGFAAWQTMAVCLLGGWLGVMYSVPLRRTLVVGSSLPFPEGVAAAEVLRVGETGQAAGIRPLARGAVAAAGFAFCSSGMKLISDSASWFFSAGHAVFRVGTSFSLALIGVGYLVGVGACSALLLGVGLAWGVAVPMLTATQAIPHGVSPADFASGVWASQVRLIGAGIIAVGGFSTVLSLAKPMAASIATAFKSRRPRWDPVQTHDHDIPIGLVAATAASLAVPLALTFAWFALGASQGFHRPALILLASGMTIFTVVFGFLMATACGYMAGLLGSSSSPISGAGILTTILVSLLLSWLLDASTAGADAERGRFVTAASLFLTSVIVATASIANDNLQDLKTGQLVGATPWRQQIALLVGVAVGSIVIAPLLDLLYRTYGLVGALPRPGMDPRSALAAPQASLISAIAKGILDHKLDWNMIYIGMAAGTMLIGAETWASRRQLRFPVLTVGIGMYLPPTVGVAIFIGGLVGWLSARKALSPTEETDGRRRRGILVASGFLVGESLAGILLAALQSIHRNNAAMASAAPTLQAVSTGLAFFAGAVLLFYRSVSLNGTPPARTAADAG